MKITVLHGHRDLCDLRTATGSERMHRS